MRARGGDCGQNRIMAFEGDTLKKQIISLALIAGLAACSGGNPFDEEEVVDPDAPVTGETDGNGITVDGIPPGTVSPTSGSSIFRGEERVDSGVNLG